MWWTSLGRTKPRRQNFQWDIGIGFQTVGQRILGLSRGWNQTLLLWPFLQTRVSFRVFGLGIVGYVIATNCTGLSKISSDNSFTSVSTPGTWAHDSCLGHWGTLFYSLTSKMFTAGFETVSPKLWWLFSFLLKIKIKIIRGDIPSNARNSSWTPALLTAKHMALASDELVTI